MQLSPGGASAGPAPSHHRFRVWGWLVSLQFRLTSQASAFDGIIQVLGLGFPMCVSLLGLQD